jgi:hypothetical protein
MNNKNKENNSSSSSSHKGITNQEPESKQPNYTNNRISAQISTPPSRNEDHNKSDVQNEHSGKINTGVKKYIFHKPLETETTPSTSSSISSEAFSSFSSTIDDDYSYVFSIPDTP